MIEPEDANDALTQKDVESHEIPKIYRLMKSDGVKPVTGSNSGELGVRDRDMPNKEADGTVIPSASGTCEGMSVNICPCSIHFTMMPERLDHIVRGAIGKNNRQVWRMGTGSFVAAPLSVDLYLQPDRKPQPSHGCVEPAKPMPEQQYQQALASTQNQWLIDESRNSDCPICS